MRVYCILKLYFNNATKTGVQTNQDFWKLIKPFLTNRGFLENAEIMLAERDKIETKEKDKIETEEKNLSEFSMITT